MSVPFLDLKQQYRGIRDEIWSAIAAVLESTQYVLGREVAGFEEEFAAYCGVRHAVAVNSGTSALHCALLAAGVGPGDEVITVPCTFVATIAAVVYTGAKPVLVDVDPVTYTMDASRIEGVISSKTKAILPVHLYGYPAAMDPVLEIAHRRGLIVIEDAAQAHGAQYRGRRCGSMGDLGCFSFYPGKNLGAYGEGGLVTTDDPELARRIRMLRDWGAEKKYQHVVKGFNYRMEAVQGAVLRVKLRYLEGWIEARRAHAAAYNRLLADSDLALPFEAPQNRHVYHLYAVLSPARNELMESLKTQGVQTGLHYPDPVHLLPAYADLGYRAGDFPISERIAKQELSLPMFPELSNEQIEEVVHSVTQFRAVPV